MVRGIAVCSIVAVMVFAGPLMAGFVPDGKDLVTTGISGSKVEILLPPGADVTEARGSLIVERLPITERVLADGTLARTLPIKYTFVNHWNETFMFDGINEAVLTDAIGERHFATSVLRDGEPLLPGVTGLIPHGGMTEFTLFYDLSAGCNVATIRDLQLDLRYLNHGHPYMLSTLIASEAGVEERPPVVEIPAPKAPEPVQVIPPPAPPPPAPIVQQPAPLPPPAPPAPEPVAVAPPPVYQPAQPAPEAPPPAPEVQPVSVPCAPFVPCAPCPPPCNPCNLLDICKLPCCLLNVVCQGAQCLTCVTAKGICDITCGSASAVKCVLGSICCDPCASPCAPCGPYAPYGQMAVAQ